MSAPQARNLALPALDGEYCVHGIIETASCRACVDVCPRQAWQLDDAALEFDADRCDGCGLCVPTCPGRAIALPSCPARREVAGTTVLVAVCDKVSTITSGAGWIG